MTEEVKKKVERFTSKDSENFVSLLNFAATKAVFNGVTMQQMIDFSRLLNWAQTSLLPKIDAHIFEVLHIKQVENKGNDGEAPTTPPPDAPQS